MPFMSDLSTLKQSKTCVCSIFSVERERTHGARGYVVTTQEELWRRYQDMLPAHRHWYEIIREGRPCHLYFGE